MTKTIFFILTFLTFVCPTSLRGDTPQKTESVITIMQIGEPTSRDIGSPPLQAVYNECLSVITTYVTTKMGLFEMAVTNLSTGEIWIDYFNSDFTIQSELPISGDPGYYEVVYTSENGSCYHGNFMIY